MQNIAGVIYLAQKQANIPHGNHAPPSSTCVPSERFANSILAKLLLRTSNNGEILVSAEAAWLNQTEISQGSITLFVTGLPQP